MKLPINVLQNDRYSKWVSGLMLIEAKWHGYHSRAAVEALQRAADHRRREEWGMVRIEMQHARNCAKLARDCYASLVNITA